MSGKRRRGRPRTRWLDNVNNIKGPSINRMMLEIETDGEVLPRLSQGSYVTPHNVIISA